MNEFEEAKNKKERGYTVKDALKDAADSRDVIIVHVDNDGLVNVSFSTETGNVPHKLGLLEMAKMMIIENSE